MRLGLALFPAVGVSPPSVDEGQVLPRDMCAAHTGASWSSPIGAWDTAECQCLLLSGRLPMKSLCAFGKAVTRIVVWSGDPMCAVCAHTAEMSM